MRIDDGERDVAGAGERPAEPDEVVERPVGR
jgi:hypothetical protein